MRYLITIFLFLSGQVYALNNNPSSRVGNYINLDKLPPANPVNAEAAPGLSILDKLKDSTLSSHVDNKRALKKVSRCQTCHNKAMSMTNSYLPILQGQKKNYLYAKIKSFDRNSRHPFPAYSQSLADDELLFIASFYAQQKSDLGLPLLEIKTNDSEVSPAISALDSCLDCHGNDGNESDQIPSISGQNDGYLSYRIREISNGDSRVHVYPLPFISCQIEPVTVRESRLMAKRFKLVSIENNQISGEKTYNEKCLKCHDAPKSTDLINWTELVDKGLDGYAKNNLKIRHIEPFRQANYQFSDNQWLKALSFLVSQ